MQTLARVNRTFRGKADGLLVAYAPLAENLHKALAEYSDQRYGCGWRSWTQPTGRRAVSPSRRTLLGCSAR